MLTTARSWVPDAKCGSSEPTSAALMPKRRTGASAAASPESDMAASPAGAAGAAHAAARMSVASSALSVSHLRMCTPFGVGEVGQCGCDVVVNGVPARGRPYSARLTPGCQVWATTVPSVRTLLPIDCGTNRIRRIETDILRKIRLIVRQAHDKSVVRCGIRGRFGATWGLLMLPGTLSLGQPARKGVKTALLQG